MQPEENIVLYSTISCAENTFFFLRTVLCDSSRACQLKERKYIRKIIYTRNSHSTAKELLCRC